MLQVPFSAGPAMVAWHPKFTATVLIASSSGLFTLADTTSHGFSPTHQVRTVPASSPVIFRRSRKRRHCPAEAPSTTNADC